MLYMLLDMRVLGLIDGSPIVIYPPLSFLAIHRAPCILCLEFRLKYTIATVCYFYSVSAKHTCWSCPKFRAILQYVLFALPVLSQEELALLMVILGLQNNLSLCCRHTIRGRHEEVLQKKTGQRWRCLDYKNALCCQLTNRLGGWVHYW